jgi:hypothetical protein
VLASNQYAVINNLRFDGPDNQELSTAKKQQRIPWLLTKQTDNYDLTNHCIRSVELPFGNNITDMIVAYPFVYFLVAADSLVALNVQTRVARTLLSTEKILLSFAVVREYVVVLQKPNKLIFINTAEAATPPLSMEFPGCSQIFSSPDRTQLYLTVREKNSLELKTLSKGFQLKEGEYKLPMCLSQVLDVNLPSIIGSGKNRQTVLVFDHAKKTITQYKIKVTSLTCDQRYLYVTVHPGLAVVYDRNTGKKVHAYPVHNARLLYSFRGLLYVVHDNNKLSIFKQIQ